MKAVSKHFFFEKKKQKTFIPWRFGVIGAGFFAIPFILGEYSTSLMTYVGLSAIVALGLVLLTGQAGLPSFGQAAFVGIGAYVAAILTLRAGWAPTATLAPCLAAAGLCGWAGARVVLRLSGHYLALASIAFAVAMYYLFAGLDITGGQTGLSGLPALGGPVSDYLIVWGVLLLLILALGNLLDSRIGRAIRTLKDHALMAEAMGIDTDAMKTTCFVIACLFAGFVGWFYAYFERFVNPSPFSLAQGIEYLFMAVLGGATMLWGAVAGAAFVSLLKPVLQAHAADLLGVSGNFEGVVFGVIVILLFQFAADGLLPRLRQAFGGSAITARPLLRSAAVLPARAPLPAGTKVLAVSHARRAFGGVLANDDVSLTVHSGEIVALIGPNGAGKSTFFDLVTGVTRADGGTFLLDGAAITNSTARAIARQGIGRSFQHVRLVPEMSVVENVAVGAHARGRRGLLAAMLRMERAEDAALLAAAQVQLDRLGLGALAWVPADSLALGQQRLVEIARALAGDPKLLLLDEPAAGLRHQEKNILAGFIRGLRDDGMGVLLVEHDMDFVMTLADRVVVMAFGRVIAGGTPREVQGNAAVRSAYLGEAA